MSDNLNEVQSSNCIDSSSITVDPVCVISCQDIDQYVYLLRLIDIQSCTCISDCIYVCVFVF